MEVSIINMKNEIVGVLDLNPLVFGVGRRCDVLKAVVNWQLAKRRSGTSRTRGISDISGTTAKPYRQKHTGRARQGSLRSPQFRGGAVIFGPEVRDHSRSLNKKVRNLGLRVALSMKQAEGKLLVIDDMGAGWEKTSVARAVFNNFGPRRSFLVVAKDYSREVSVACRNLCNVDLLKHVGINVLDVLRHDCVMLTVDSVRYLEDRLL